MPAFPKPTATETDPVASPTAAAALALAESHAARHKSGGADAIKLDEFAAPTDVTTLNADASKHGLLPKLDGSSSKVLLGDGTWGAAASSPVLYVPSWNGLLAAAYDPALATSQNAFAGGYGYGSRVYAPQALTISNVVCYVYSQGSALTANKCQVGIYNSSGTLVGRNSDVSAAFQSTGLKTVAITAESGQSLAVAAGGWFHVFAVFNGTTKPQLHGRGDAISGLANANLSAATARFLTIGSGSLTALPASTSGSPSATSVAHWFGVS